jgi:hypothetical protein
MQIMEVSPDGSTVWEYELPHVPQPFSRGVPATLRASKFSHPGDIIDIGNNRALIIHARRYAPSQVSFLSKKKK